LPRHWQLEPSRPCANSPASPSSPRPSAICGRAGPHWCVARCAVGCSSRYPRQPCRASSSRFVGRE
jgi:hypothetical protein